jgi:hypothetical protein
MKSSSKNWNKKIMPRITTKRKPDDELMYIFWTACEEAYFDQFTIALITCRSVKTLECDRWRKIGAPYRKVGGKILYQKKDVLKWLGGHKLIKGKQK